MHCMKNGAGKQEGGGMQNEGLHAKREAAVLMQRAAAEAALRCRSQWESIQCAPCGGVGCNVVEAADVELNNLGKGVKHR